MLGEDPQRFMFQFPGLLRNTKVLEHAAAGRGLFTIKPERDGIVRRVPMIMLAQGQTMPSLSFEMLRVATGSGTILIKSEKAGIKSLGIKGFQLPTDGNGQLWVHYARQDPSLYVPVIERAGKDRCARNDRGQAGPDRHLGRRSQRHQDHAGFAEHAGRGNPRPDSGKRVERGGDLAADLRHRRRIRDRAAVRAAGDRVRAAVRADHAGRARCCVCDRADRNVGVFLFAAQAADRFHLSPDVDHVDLSHADLFQLRARAGAAAADPLAIRPIHVAGPGRATRAAAGKARARRRGARDDHHVLRHARLHLDLGDLQGRPAGADRV